MAMESTAVLAVSMESSAAISPITVVIAIPEIKETAPATAMQTEAMQMAVIQTAVMRMAVMQMEAMRTEAMQTAVIQMEAMQTEAMRTKAMWMEAMQTEAMQTATAIYRLANVVSTGFPLYGSL